MQTAWLATLEFQALGGAQQVAEVLGRAEELSDMAFDGITIEQRHDHEGASMDVAAGRYWYLARVVVVNADQEAFPYVSGEMADAADGRIVGFLSEAIYELDEGSEVEAVLVSEIPVYVA